MKIIIILNNQIKKFRWIFVGCFRRRISVGIHWRKISDGNVLRKFPMETRRRKLPTERHVGSYWQKQSSEISDKRCRRFFLTLTIPTIFVGRNTFRQITDNFLLTNVLLVIRRKSGCRNLSESRRKFRQISDEFFFRQIHTDDHFRRNSVGIDVFPTKFRRIWLSELACFLVVSRDY